MQTSPRGNELREFEELKETEWKEGGGHEVPHRPVCPTKENRPCPEGKARHFRKKEQARSEGWMPKSTHQV